METSNRKPAKKRVSKSAAQKAATANSSASELQLVGEMLFDVVASIPCEEERPTESVEMRMTKRETAPVMSRGLSDSLFGEIPVAPQMVNLGSTLAPEMARFWSGAEETIPMQENIVTEPVAETSVEVSAEPTPAQTSAQTPAQPTPAQTPFCAPKTTRRHLSWVYTGGTLCLMMCVAVFIVQIRTSEEVSIPSSVVPQVTEISLDEPQNTATVSPTELFETPVASENGWNTPPVIEAIAVEENEDDIPQFNGMLAGGDMRPAPMNTAIGSQVTSEDVNENYPTFNAPTSAPYPVPESSAVSAPVAYVADNNTETTMDEVPVFNPTFTAPAPVYVQPSANVGGMATIPPAFQTTPENVAPVAPVMPAYGTPANPAAPRKLGPPPSNRNVGEVPSFQPGRGLDAADASGSLTPSYY